MRREDYTRRNVLVEGGTALINTALTAEIALILTTNADNAASVERNLLSREESFVAKERLKAIERSPLFHEEYTKKAKRFSSRTTATNEQGGTYQIASPLESALSAGCQETLDDRERLSRIDYLRKHVMEGVTDEELPDEIREELTFLIVGLPAQESSYENDVVSSAKAVGLAQILPNIHKAYGFDEVEIKYLKNVTVFLREFFKSLYSILWSEAGDALDFIRANYFDTPEEFNRQFMTLVMINAYQAGPGNVAQVLRWFSKQKVRPTFKHYDVYAAMASAAGAKGGPVPDYGKHSANYVKNVYAFAMLLNSCDTKVKKRSA
ncbi:MAG: hypothetical protein ABA06_01570 [Parcubacteria bacterium C7867-001]|nr:MAG: hypothetical protein ABA06_01570 [Parcubacteria bacterium C7867-001]